MIGPARVLVADPPWAFEDRLARGGKSAQNHYDVLPLYEIKRFPLPPLADDAVLFLWRVAGGNNNGSLGEDAYDVARTWGFTPKTEIVWRKLTRTGKEHFGMGHYVRASHEVCLIATRGRPKPLIRNVRSVFDAPVGRHSQKPDLFYGIVTRMFAGPYVELFARTARPGWLQYGNQLEGAEAQP